VPALRDEIEKLPGILSLLLPLLLAGTQPTRRRASNPDLQVTSIQPDQPSLEPCTLTQTVQTWLKLFLAAGLEPTSHPEGAATGASCPFRPYEKMEPGARFELTFIPSSGDVLSRGADFHRAQFGPNRASDLARKRLPHLPLPGPRIRGDRIKLTRHVFVSMTTKT